MSRVKKNDQVIVLSGKDKGKKGTVLQVVPDINKVVVQGIGIVVRHVKQRKQGDIAGIKREESLISLSKVMPVCSSCNKPCRVRAKKVDDSGKKSRACHRCSAIL